MKITKQNTLIEISELGLKLEIKADLLMNALISENTKKVLNEMLQIRLLFLLGHFEKMDETIELERKKNILKYYHSLKENRNEYIYEYACLSRDLYSLLGDTFDNFYEKNSSIMETISGIYKYTSLYGFNLSKTVDV